MNLLSLLETLRLLLVILIGLIFSYQLLYLILPLFRRHLAVPSDPKLHRYAILIAARNEEAVLPHLLDSIHAQNYPAELITTYVIADNCTDQTARVAAEKGALVHQRYSTTKIGKGHALNFLLNQLQLSGELEQYDAFLIFDADNLLSPDFVSQINVLSAQGFDAFCGYRNSKNFGSNWLSCGYALWYLHESAQLNQSRMMLGSSCAVNGTGFGFTRQLLETIGGWNFLTLTEDIEFSTWCAIHGIRIGYCHDAILYDEQPTSFRVSVRQRTRWIQGGLQVSWRYRHDYLRGIAQGGKPGWASFETATRSLWGYGLSAVSFLLTVLISLLSGGIIDLVRTFLVMLTGAYLSLLAIAFLVVITQWRRIRATPWQKLKSLFAFPVFRLSYIPIAVTAIFRKFQWQPIAHTVAIPVSQLQK